MKKIKPIEQTPRERILALQDALQDRIRRECERFEAATGMTVTAISHPRDEYRSGHVETAAVRVHIRAPEPSPKKQNPVCITIKN